MHNCFVPFRILERTTALVTDMIQREEQLQHMKKEVHTMNDFMHLQS